MHPHDPRDAIPPASAHRRLRRSRITTIPSRRASPLLTLPLPLFFSAPLPHPGEELGDPCCHGTPVSSTAYSHPGFASSVSSAARGLASRLRCAASGGGLQPQPPPPLAVPPPAAPNNPPAILGIVVGDGGAAPLVAAAATAGAGSLSMIVEPAAPPDLVSGLPIAQSAAAGPPSLATGGAAPAEDEPAAMLVPLLVPTGPPETIHLQLDPSRPPPQLPLSAAAGCAWTTTSFWCRLQVVFLAAAMGMLWFY